MGLTEIYSKALDKTIETERIVGKLVGKRPGPTLIFTGGIHGNEPSGVFALRQVLNELKGREEFLCGSMYAICGNLWALEHGARFHQQDLNRLWMEESMAQLRSGNFVPKNEDEQQQLEIYNAIFRILKEESGPFYFIDLHTTSSQTVPFLTVNDSLMNRKFTEHFPVPMILGIEEFLDGPLLSYINELGYVAFGYEGGQHDDPQAIKNHVAFIYLSLLNAGVIPEDLDLLQGHHEALRAICGNTQGVYEIYFRYEIGKEEQFTMKPGFSNFQQVAKGTELATSNGQTIRATRHGRIFMPLYQSQGEDGFFAIRRIPKFFLNLSGFLRRIRFDRILLILPGVRWMDKSKGKLIVNKRIAFIFPKQFLHLLGYRSKQLDINHLIVKNREAAARTKEYDGVKWL